jgi:hypothetical protein
LVTWRAQEKVREFQKNNYPKTAKPVQKQSASGHLCRTKTCQTGQNGLVLGILGALFASDSGLLRFAF